MKAGHFSNQLWWVILPLLAAVILPTICLLWFMNTAVKNERLAVQQKLIDQYTKQAKYFFVEVPNLYFGGQLDHLNSYPIAESHNFFELFAVDPKAPFKGMLIYDKEGNLLHPVEMFITDEDSAEAVTPFGADKQEAIELAYKRSYPANPESLSPEAAAAAMRSRVFLAERYFETCDDRLFYHLRRILGNSRYGNEPENGFLIGPADATVWQFGRLIDLARRAGLADRLTEEIRAAENHIAAYENALNAAELYPTAQSLLNWPGQTVRRLAPKSELYGFKITVASQTVLGILTPDKVFAILNAAVRDMQDDAISIQVFDNFGSALITAVDKTEKPFLILNVGTFLPEFAISVFIKNSSVFENAAQRQTSIYTWTGILVIGMVAMMGLAAARAVGHQMKMNRLKNDFVATVTHELKTPLASMRLLVDTLLEKRCPDEKAAEEYLQMIAKENERLTHLIDSFLTFSRMERNKQVFDFQPITPAEMVAGAIEAVRTKFSNNHCAFKFKIEDNVPAVNADKDAMVTVLVNLLDNACKYTKEDKQIELKVSAENGSICFAVRDNGIGITKRAQKKIFNRFYQVDSRLSRSVEGCGLGLSIVKFIVDAHKGTIEVQSKSGQGSTFTVKLPQIEM